MNLAALLKSKAIWTGLAAVAAAGLAYANGEATQVEAVQLAVTGLLGIFLRLGIAKV